MSRRLQQWGFKLGWKGWRDACRGTATYASNGRPFLQGGVHFGDGFPTPKAATMGAMMWRDKGRDGRPVRIVNYWPGQVPAGHPALAEAQYS